MDDLLTREEKRELLRNMVKQFEGQQLQYEVERVMNLGNPSSDQKALRKRVEVIAAGLKLVKERFADLLADDPEPSVEDGAQAILDQVAAVVGDEA